MTAQSRLTLSLQAVGADVGALISSLAGKLSLSGGVLSGAVTGVPTVETDVDETLVTKGYADSIAGGDSVSVAEVGAIASGSTLDLEQSLLANDGQPALTVLGVGYTNTGKVCGVSLGNGNMIEVYATGADYNNGVVKYREFCSEGEPIAFTDVWFGAIITSTAGFGGVSEGVDATDQAPMTLLSFGLAFKKTLLFAFRDSNEYGIAGNDRGFVWLFNGPLASVVDFTFGDGTVVQGQSGISLDPWEGFMLETDGNVEYIISSTNKVFAGIHAAMSDPDGVTGTNNFKDARIVMPMTADGITWPRSGYISALYDNTQCDFYVRDGAKGTINSTSGAGVSPGSPVDFDAAIGVGTGASDADYETNGATRIQGKGQFSAYSGADGAGNNASPLMPTSAMSQVLPQPFYIADSGDGGNSNVSIASPYEGTAWVYEWDDTTGALKPDPTYTVPLTRTNVTVATAEDQLHPAAGMIANETVDGAVLLVGQLNAGIIKSNVPITVVIQNNDKTLMPTVRSQNGTVATWIQNSADETLMLGMTPPDLKAEIVVGEDGLRYRRIIGAGGVESWALT